MPTAHINAKEEEIAKTVIMSGDPLRAKFIAETYLTDYKLVNTVRNMFAYTGYYKGKRITVMGHGMGMAGSGIYFYELYKFYNVDTIIRIGSCGTFYKDIKLLDIILVESSYTESNFAYLFSKENVHIEYSNKELNEKIRSILNLKNIAFLSGTIMTTDVFDNYVDWREIVNRIPMDLEILGAEMESFALFHIAKDLNKKAACLLSVVDSKFATNVVTSEDREKGLTKMIEVALDSIL